ncbi:MAG: hypothetical protein ABI618_14445, partial [Nitrospirota bacterium]
QADQFLLESELACAADLRRDKHMEPAEHKREGILRPVSIGLRQERRRGASHARWTRLPSPLFSFSSICANACDNKVRAGLFIGDLEHREMEGPILSA